MQLKQEILAELARHGETPVSGQVLAQKFGVSRNAVWKAVQALKQQGYLISSATNRGYQLEPGSDILRADTISALLQEQLPVYVYSSLDSTNSEAKRLLVSGTRCPFLVAAEEQTDGRGRRGHAFYSPPGAGLYMSLAMSPAAALDHALCVTAYAAVCTARAIEQLTGRLCKIKWVNDLYFEEKKVCGILTEAMTDFESGDVDAVVIGIGVNLHPFAVPEDLRDVVGCLDTPAIKNNLAAEITRQLLRFDARDRRFVEEYRRRSMVLGKTVQFTRNGQILCGVATEIDDTGALHVQLENERVVLRSGAIQLCADAAR